MLYKQLQRINQLDQQIHDLHLKLSEYYAERARLTEGDTPAPEPVVLQSVEPSVVTSLIPTTDPQQLYNQLVTTWQQHSIKLPAFKSLRKRLTKAATIIDTLQAANPQLNGNLSVVAAPPQKQLDQLIQSGTVVHKYVFSEDYDFQTTASTTWNIVVVTSLDFSLPIEQISDTLGAAEFEYKSYDCRALGVRELIAADIQGVEIMTDSNWTLLLKDATDSTYVPCVTLQGETVVFDIDDTRCLLGNNYLQPAIEAK